VSGLSKSYGRLRALENVAFSIRAGEVLGLIGPNGAGKTTLFECLAGVQPSTTGVLLRDESVLDARARKELLFYMPDAIAPWPAQSVGWALDFTLGFFGGPRDRRDEVVGAMALGTLLGAPIGALSKGERKRTLLALALLTPQPILLIDEPFDGLDLRQSRQAAAALLEHARHGRTLFLSIHQIAEAARLCDRFVLLSGGKVCAEGTLDELRARARAAPSAECGPARGEPALDLEAVFLALT